MVRGIVKKFKTTGTVVNKPGRGRKFILPPRTVRRMVREIKKSPKLTVTELHQMVASWGHKVSKTTIRRYLHANKLFGRHARKKIIAAFFGVAPGDHTTFLRKSLLRLHAHQVSSAPGATISRESWIKNSGGHN